MLFCSPRCRSAPAPAVYRFICPDGRSYVGSVSDNRKRAEQGIQRSNPYLLAAFEKHPPESFKYELLELLPPGCSERKLRTAEQRHIDHFQSWSPDGFNIYPAIWEKATKVERAAMSKPRIEAQTAKVKAARRKVKSARVRR